MKSSASDRHSNSAAAGAKQNREGMFVRFGGYGMPLGIFLLAVLVRVIAAAGLNYYLSVVAGRDYLIEGDAAGYWELAGKLVAGEDFSLYSPPRFVLRMPGFPAVLAVSIGLLGESLFAARYFLAVLTSLAVFPAIALGECWHSRQAGAAAGVLIALMPVYVGFSVTILTECLFAAVIMAHVWASARWLDSLRETPVSRSILWGLLAGILAAAAVYLRPSWLLEPVAVVLIGLAWQPARWQRGLLSGGVMLAVMWLCLLPWGLRNQQVTGHFVTTTLWMGPSLYDGLRPGATGDSDMTFFDAENVLAHMSEYEMNDHYKERAWQFARENPRDAVRLGLVKFWRFWKPWPNAEQFQHPILRFAVAAGFLFLVFWAIYGSWVMWRKWCFVFLCWLPIVYFTALHLLFVSSLRYRLPAEFPLAVLAGIGLVSGWQTYVRTKSRG